MTEMKIWDALSVLFLLSVSIITAWILYLQAQIIKIKKELNMEDPPRRWKFWKKVR